jgi:hypothetical protein
MTPLAKIIAVALLRSGCATYGRVGPLPVVPDGIAAAEILVGRE